MVCKIKTIDKDVRKKEMKITGVDVSEVLVATASTGDGRSECGEVPVALRGTF